MNEVGGRARNRAPAVAQNHGIISVSFVVHAFCLHYGFTFSIVQTLS